MGAITRAAANNFTTGGVILPAAVNDASVASITSLTQIATGGGLELISTSTASNSAFIEFSGASIFADYNVHMFELININSTSGASAPNFGFNGTNNLGVNWNTPKTTATVQNYQTEAGTASAFYNTSFDLAQGTGNQYLNYGDNDTAADASLNGRVWFFGLNSTTFVKHFIAVTNHSASDPSTEQNYTAGYINTTDDVNGILWGWDSGNIESGKIKFYGLVES